MREREAEIVRVAFDIMGESGPEGLHARTVAARIGKNHATVHYYFRSRKDLLVAVAEEAIRRLQLDRKKLRDAASTPSEELETVLSLAENYSRAQHPVLRVVAGLCAVAPQFPEVADTVSDFWKEWVEGLRDMIERSKSDLDSGSPFLDPETLGATMFGLVMGRVMDSKGGEPTEQIDGVFASLFK